MKDKTQVVTNRQAGKQGEDPNTEFFLSPTNLCETQRVTFHKALHKTTIYN